AHGHYGPHSRLYRPGDHLGTSLEFRRQARAGKPDLGHEAGARAHGHAWPHATCLRSDPMQTEISRRSFLSSAGAAAAVLSTGSLPIPAAEPKKRSIKKGIMFGTVGVKGSVLEKFRAVKDAGFEGVEPNSHMNQDEVLKAKEATGLQTPSVC